VGALLADQWGFPAPLSSAIAGHHDPSASGAAESFVVIIHIADVMAHLIGSSILENEVPPPLEPSALEKVQLPPERLRIIAETEAGNLKRIEELCNVFGALGPFGDEIDDDRCVDRKGDVPGKRLRCEKE
jgi:HD-like signal output (HDOD) protein